MKYKKNELLRLVSRLENTNQTLKNTVASRQPLLVQILVECQKIAIEIGTYLDMKGTACEPAVRILEEYCENIYQQSTHLNDDHFCIKTSKKIQKQLVQIRHVIKYNLPNDKKEFVFLPYKASMWDSLESVWLAATEDEECEAYVIPIPYFDRNFDGTLGQMHYEGREYPDYVPITDWQEYRLAERKPDVSFIHNPYDEYNRVTTVHPLFYTKELKKYTDMLVYIPYFVGVDDYVGEHFCTTPGVLYSDRAIVESDKVRKKYIKQFLKFEAENNCKGKLGDPKVKILALGSPKLDRVANTKKEMVEIPKEWKRLINKADGTNKKVVLYNTSIGTLLEKNEKVLEKIEKVFRLFKENTDIVLLWRPHPLIVATLQAMRPALLVKYQAIVEKFCKEGWGIYDNTADLERAIAISDAYYGDMSSVVELYKSTGKPLMIQYCEDEM